MQKTTLAVCLLFATHFLYCQVAVPASGGDAIGQLESILAGVSEEPQFVECNTHLLFHGHWHLNRTN